MKAARTTTPLNFHCPKTREDMTIIDGQEFCSSCNRTLIDFTFLNDAELKDALAKLAGSKSCGVFRADQVTLSAKQKFVQRLRQVASLTIALFSIKAANAKVGDGAVPASHNEEEQAGTSLQNVYAPDARIFKGRLVENKDFDGLGYEEIYLTNAEGEILQKSVTDINGLFQFDLTQVADSADLRIVTNISDFKNTSVPLNTSQSTFTYLIVDDEMNLEVSSDLELYLLKRIASKEKRMFFPYMHVRRPMMRGAF